MHAPRIAICSFSRGTANGIAQMDDLLCDGLTKAGFAMSRFCLDSSRKSGCTKESGIQILSLDCAFSVLREAFDAVDIVQFNGSFDPCVYMAATEAGVPCIVEAIHSTEQGGMYPHIDVLVCVSKRVREAQKYPHCRIIHNGIDLHRFTFKHGRRHTHDAAILQVANSTKQLHAGLDDLLPELLTTHSGTRGLLAGGRKHHPHPCMRDYGVQKNMEELYHAADLVFMPSVHDAFGLALVEGMACGCLPLGNAFTGASECIEHGLTGWLMGNSRQDMLDTLRLAIDTLGTPQYENMQRMARSTVEDKFSAARCLSQYASLYRELWQNRSPWQERTPAPVNWMPLLFMVMLCSIDLERAKVYFEKFVRAGKILEPILLDHPNGRITILAALRLSELLSSEGQHSLVRTFCALLRASHVHLPQLETVEKLCCG